MLTDRPVPLLSPREQQLLKLAAAGFTDTAIAEQLGISEATVGTYWGRVRIKFGPYSRTELVAIMLRAESQAAVENLRLENEHIRSELQIHLSSGSSLSPREILEHAADSIVLVSEAGIIEYANVAAYEMFGYVSPNLQGLHINALVPPRFRAKHSENSEEYFQNPTRRQMGQHLDTPAFRKDGTEFLVRAALSTIDSSSGKIVMCAVRAA